jgi:hypothetical protein
MEMKKVNRARFMREILRGFVFLTSEFGLRRSSRVYAYEHVDRYRDDHLLVSIYVAHPELPFITIRVNSEPARDYSFWPDGQRDVAKIKRRYYRELEKHSTSNAAVAEIYQEVAALQAAAVRTAVKAIRAKRRLGPVWAKKKQ